jgi:hypothetical protein
MRVPFFLLFAALSISAANAGTDTVEIADYHDWGNSPAFYVDASRSIGARMAVAVVNARKSNSTACSSSPKPFWLCTSSPLRFFRGISGNGRKQQSGYVCRDEDWLKRHKYYPIKELTDASCVYALWDPDDQAYELRWPDAQS